MAVMGEELLDAIDSDPSVLPGQARFRGTRVSVSVVLDCLAAGMTSAEIHEHYPIVARRRGANRGCLWSLVGAQELYPLKPTSG
jgi:uncharacterized protein (DUF433 family)